MEIKIQPTPHGGCGKCGRAASSATIIGTRCAKPAVGGPCDGLYRATQSTADWLICACCHGSGRTGAQRCALCEGSGWNYARPRFP